MQTELTRRPGRNLLYGLMRKRDRLDIRHVGLADLLYTLLGDRQAARSIAEYANNDLRSLSGKSAIELLGLPGVGEAQVAKVIALFELTRRVMER